MTTTAIAARPAHPTIARPVAVVPAVRVRIAMAIDHAHTTSTLERLAAATDPRTARELRRTWR